MGIFQTEWLVMASGGMPYQTELPFISFHGNQGKAGEQSTNQSRRMECRGLTVGIQVPVVSSR
jgi:hypothetical protein